MYCVSTWPANADFQQFLADLTAAARATLMQPDRFDAFAKAVLRGGYSAAKAAQLRIEFGAWVKQFGDFMDASLPSSPWGPGRVDAFGMIINRVAGRNLGIPSNFKIADAPVNYPFLWNASRQDRTQWNGSFPNGLYIQALARNTGQVLGVFATFKPERIGPYIPAMPPTIWYGNNSADFVALQSFEEKSSNCALHHGQKRFSAWTRHSQSRAKRCSKHTAKPATQASNRPSSARGPRGSKR